MNKITSAFKGLIFRIILQLHVCNLSHRVKENHTSLLTVVYEVYILIVLVLLRVLIAQRHKTV